MEQTSQIIDQQPNSSAEITLEELYRRLRDRSLTIVDVLPREAYVTGHLPGAISLPLAEVNSRAGKMIPNREAEIAVYCAAPT